MSNSIIDVIKGEVFPLFGKGIWEEGAKILRRLSFNISEDNSTEEKRMVYYNLAWVLDEIGQVELSKKYTLIIKDIVEKDKEYISTNEEKYCTVLKLYEHHFADETMSIEEKIKLNEKIYTVCRKNINTIDQAIVAKQIIYFIKEDYEGVIDLIEMIHNYRVTKKINGEAITPDIIAKIDKVQYNLLKKLKDKNPSIYEDFIEEYPLLSKIAVTT